MSILDLNLSSWIERRAADIGPHADHIVQSVRAYEREIAQLREALYHADEGLTYLHMYDEAQYSKPAQRCVEGDGASGEQSE